MDKIKPSLFGTENKILHQESALRMIKRDRSGIRRCFLACNFFVNLVVAHASNDNRCAVKIGEVGLGITAVGIGLLLLIGLLLMVLFFLLG